MQLEPGDLFPESFPCSSDARLDVLVIYENILAGKKAKEVCDSLMQRLGEPWQMDLELLNFGSLQVEREAVLYDRDIVIISCGNGKLPKPVRTWIDSFARQPRLSGALVGLIAVPAWERNRPPNNAKLFSRRGAATQHEILFHDVHPGK